MRPLRLLALFCWGAAIALCVSGTFAADLATSQERFALAGLLVLWVFGLACIIDPWDD